MEQDPAASAIIHFLRRAKNMKRLLIFLVCCVCCLMAAWHVVNPLNSTNSFQSPWIRAAGGNRILCWVVTQPVNHQTKAKAVKETWGKKCDKLLFVSSQNDSTLPAIGFTLPGNESRRQLWNKAKLTIQHVYQNYLDQFDWFYKADDDTYAIMENLRTYISTMDSTLPWFLGRHFKRKKDNVDHYLTGGPGYLLTRKTLQLLVEQGLNKNECEISLTGNMDDVIIGWCLEKLGALFADTRDYKGRHRFLHCNLLELYQQDSRCFNQTRNNDFYPHDKDSNRTFSDQIISVHHVKVEMMYMLEFLIYNLQVDKRPEPAALL